MSDHFGTLCIKGLNDFLHELVSEKPKYFPYILSSQISNFLFFSCSSSFESIFPWIKWFFNLTSSLSDEILMSAKYGLDIILTFNVILQLVQVNVEFLISQWDRFKEHTYLSYKFCISSDKCFRNTVKQNARFLNKQAQVTSIHVTEAAAQRCS